MAVIVTDRGDAVEMVVTGPWTDEATEIIQAGQVDRLLLNYALGFDEPSLWFLDGLPLRELVLLDWGLSDLEPIHSLGPTLQSLDVTTNPALTLDLGRLPGLRELGAAWRQVSASIDAATRLQDLFLLGYRPTDLKPLAALTHLVKLVMKDRPKVKSLAGLSAFPDLRVLEIYLAQSLTDIEDLAGRSALEEVALEACRKIDRLDALGECITLRSLNLSDCGELASLGPLRALTNLEDVLMYGSTKIVDGDLSPLAALPRLQELRLQSRRSYRPSVDEIEALLPRS